MQAIVESARRRLNDDDELTMRAVASDVGLTGPGLYRYLNSLAELQLLLIHEAIGAARQHIEAAGEPYESSLDKLIAGAVALRMWALTYPAEFRLAFASPGLADSYSQTELTGLAQRLGVDRLNSPGLMGEYFGPLFRDRLGHQEYWVTPDIAETFKSQATAYQVDVAHRYQYLSAAHGPESVWAFLYLWSRLYGVIAFEVFNHLEPDTVASALLFRVTLFEMTSQVGTELDMDRTNQIIDAEIARMTQQIGHGLDSVR